MLKTRAYRDGEVVCEDFPLSDLASLREGHDMTLWIDLESSDRDDLKQVAQLLGLHPLAVEDALEEHQRAKLDRYDTHLFIASYAISVPQPADGVATADSEDLIRHELDMFVTPDTLVTVRAHGDFDMQRVLRRWESHPGLIAHGVTALLWGVLDVIVDSHFDTIQQLDEHIDALEEAVFAVRPDTAAVQRAAFVAHKNLVTMRRLALPMREVVGELMRLSEIVRDPTQHPSSNAQRLHVLRDLVTDSPGVHETIEPYYQDVYDHTLRVADATDSLRDMVSTILDTNLTAQGNRLNLIMKQVTSWAAIIAVPTLVTGYFGMNVDFPGYGTFAAFVVATVLIAVTSVALYSQFKRRDWL